MKKDQRIPDKNTSSSPIIDPRVNSCRFKLVVMRKIPTIPEKIPIVFFFEKLSPKANQLRTATQTTLKLTSKEDFDAVVYPMPTY